MPQMRPRSPTPTRMSVTASLSATARPCGAACWRPAAAPHVLSNLRPGMRNSQPGNSQPGGNAQPG
eukprot:8259573-Alexandrium_andersonii.AAC.1